jgi:hypothetical protein
MLSEQASVNIVTSSAAEAIAKAKASDASSVQTTLGFDVSQDCKKWMDLALDPLGQGSGLNPKMRAARIPDGSGAETLLLVFTGRATVTGNSYNANHIMLMTGFGADGYNCIQLYRSDAANDVLDNASLYPDANYRYQPLETTVGQSLLTTAREMRVVAAAIRGVPVSSAYNTTGYMVPIWSNKFPMYNTTSYNTYSTLRTRTAPKQFATAEGCTVRMRYTDDCLDYSGVEALGGKTATNSTTLENNAGEMPGIACVGMSTTTQVLYTWVEVVELKVHGDILPFPTYHPFPELHVKQVIAFLNDMPQAVSGHSFSSFVSGLWKGGKKLIKNVLPVASNIAGMVPGGQFIKAGLDTASRVTNQLENLGGGARSKPAKQAAKQPPKKKKSNK